MRYAISIFLGLGLFALTLVVTPPAGMNEASWHVAGLALWMAVWWLTEVVPIAVTSLLPIVVAPLLGLAPIQAVTSAYAHPIIYLFLGGFILGLAMQRWGLHKRMALLALLAVGDRPIYIVAGFMAVTAFLSMWVSNTAVTIIMLPIALSVLQLGQARMEYPEFEKALLLAIAYSATIGGIATLIGTAPNALLAAYLSNTYHIELTFAGWLLIALPISLGLLIFTWFWLTVVQFGLRHMPSLALHRYIDEALDTLGPMQRAEKMVLVIFLFTACAWITRPFVAEWLALPITDSTIAVVAALILFLVPVKEGEQGRTYLMRWHDTQQLPWGILLLFGGGLSLAMLMQDSGLALWIADLMHYLTLLPLLLIVMLLVMLIIFLTELTSNTATTATFLPPLGALAITLGVSPAWICIPATIAASCAFMMPVATPPNAIVMADSDLHIMDMFQAGLGINLFGVLFVGGVGYWLVTMLM